MCKKFLLFTVVLVMISSCGGGGGNSQPAAAPTSLPAAFDLIFPGEASLTDANQITVVGMTEANRVSSVTIKTGTNDIVATLDINGRWRASAVPLQPGANTLVAELTLTDGGVTERTIAVVESSPILSNPSGVLFDAVNNRVFVADAKQLLAFDLATEMLEVISSAQIGTGPKFNFAQHLAFAGDGGILVADFRRVQRVDPTTGDRTDHIEFPGRAPLITSIARDQQLNRLFMLGLLRDLYVADLDAAPPIFAMTVRPTPTIAGIPDGPTDSAYVARTDSIYFVEPSSLGVSAINGASGELEFLMLDTGGVPVTPTVGIDYDVVEDRLLVLALSGTVFSLDPITGSSGVLLAANATVSSPKAINGLSQGNEKLWTVSPAASELISIDMSSGSQTVEVDSRVGGGAPPGFMVAGRYDASANRIVAVSDLGLIAIDAATGSRELLADLFNTEAVPGQSGGLRSISLLSGLALSQDGTRVWLTDLTGILVEVNLDNGEIREVSGPNTGSGLLPDQFAGIAVNAAETVAYVGERFSRRIFRVDLVTGQRDVLPEFAANLDRTEIRALELDANANRLILYIAQSTPAAVGSAIYAVDLASFELTLVKDLTEVLSPFDTISVPGFPTTQMSLSADGSSLFFPVSGNPDIPYVRIDLASGALVPLGDAISGPPFFIPNAIDAAPDGRLFALDGTSALYVIDAQTGERIIVSK